MKQFFIIVLGLVLINFVLMGCGAISSEITKSSQGSSAPLCVDDQFNSSACATNANRYVYTSQYGGGSFAFFSASNMSRDRTTTQLTQSQEVVTYAGTNNLPTGYRPIPKTTDDDGYSSNKRVFVDRTTSLAGPAWGSSTCGLIGTLEQRIENCQDVFGTEWATWDGATKANSGQGVWKLVTRTGNLTSQKGREVWRDERTKLLWSSLVATAQNWCKASGSNNITNNPYAENDPQNYCNNVLYQNTGVGPAAKAISTCYEDGEEFYSTSDPSIDNAGKAGLGWSSTPRITWRLPTQHDYMQAVINGLNLVMPDNMGATWFVNEWAATTSAWSHVYGYSFYSNANGEAFQITDRKLTVNGARCVGR